MESHLLSASMRSRDNLYLILDYITAKQYSREFQILIGKIKEYYDRDQEAKRVVREVFDGMLEATVQNKKHFENFTNILNDAEAIDTSDANMHELIIKTKMNEIAQKLAVSLMNGDKDVPDLISQYQELQLYTELDELGAADIEILTADDIDDVLARAVGRVGQYKLYPVALDERVEGRAAGGHHLVFFARPEMGKSAMNVTLACGFARHGHDGIYVINEDRIDDIYLRLISNLSGLTYHEIMKDYDRAKALAMENGLGHIRLVSLAPGNRKQVEALCDKFRPKWMIMDQLRNLDMGEANKVLQLEFATSFLRNMAKKYNLLMCSSTQAGDSGEGKKLLTMGDVDFSNTGVAAQADLLVGIGGDALDVQEGRRILNISKNKLAAKHENFPVKLVAPLSRYVSYRGD